MCPYCGSAITEPALVPRSTPLSLRSRNAMFLAASAMAAIAVETVSCVTMYGGATDCSREDCGGAPYIRGNERASDAQGPSAELDASDASRPSNDADADAGTSWNDAESTRDATLDASGD